MICRRCSKEMDRFWTNEVEDGDKPGNSSAIMTFQCFDCNLEYDAVYHITSLWCVSRDTNGGGGEIPLDLREGQKLFNND